MTRSNVVWFESGARIMSLTDGTSKMSKSAPLDNSRINMLDSPKLVENKIKRCKTDAIVSTSRSILDRAHSV
jgi:tryptophanyl-tRNA synthetase